jgi:hypothetical protein
MIFFSWSSAHPVVGGQPKLAGVALPDRVDIWGITVSFHEIASKEDFIYPMRG